MPLPTTPELQNLLDQDLNLKDLFAILAPENNLVLADEMMLSDAEGTILYVSENYERRFGFSKGSIVGRSAFELEAEGVFDPCVHRHRHPGEAQGHHHPADINHTHMNVLTVGVPLFNSRNELKYEVCFNTVSMEQINAIQQQYRTLQESLQQYSAELQDLRARNTDTNGLFFQGPRMQRVWSLIQNIAGTKANILITGETGVGKSVIAKTIHRLSNRSQGPFIEVNCAVLHENLIESELFGYEKGAFTGASSGGKIGKIELANHGTLFLDEIGELPPARTVQAPAAHSGKGHRAGLGQPAHRPGFPPHRRHQPESGGGHPERALPQRPLLPAQCGADSHSAPAGAAGGNLPPGLPLSGPLQPGVRQEEAHHEPPLSQLPGGVRTGRETSGSWKI